KQCGVSLAVRHCLVVGGAVRSAGDRAAGRVEFRRLVEHSRSRAGVDLLGFGIAQLVSTAAWPIAILGGVTLGIGLAWPGYRLWQMPAASDVLVSERPT